LRTYAQICFVICTYYTSAVVSVSNGHVLHIRVEFVKTKILLHLVHIKYRFWAWAQVGWSSNASDWCLWNIWFEFQVESDSPD